MRAHIYIIRLDQLIRNGKSKLVKFFYLVIYKLKKRILSHKLMIKFSPTTRRIHRCFIDFKTIMELLKYDII